jgi:AraC-like DNA-binding protein
LKNDQAARLRQITSVDSEHQDVSSAAFMVGYESPSQFSREYSQLFGVAPKRDIAALHGQG